ncbi:hypothetical protein [Paracidobacterium acidisoli]|uniref:Uncharacterized protein n=1 Tax=Paracidobacterium acidisoli TaxID=2303751 RepID=A0A372IPZ4_9BACT|nr:hypothetical protein [Paracidobacterium acidisoli]MBT9331276.1 hypothetical protein [Paracidobacterium acidisoli]
MMASVKVFAITLLLVAAMRLPAQSCPSQNNDAAAPGTSTLNGVIRVHHELRDWIAVELTQPACGEKSIQLTFDTASASEHAASLDGCHATVRGSIDSSPTGYYSANLFIANAAIRPAAGCRPKPVRAKPPAAAPSNLRSYQVSVTIDIAKNAPLQGRAWRTDGQKDALTPWQSYGKTSLTGGYVLYVGCREGFHPAGVSSATKDQVSVDEDLKQAMLAPDETRPSEITVSCAR